MREIKFRGMIVGGGGWAFGMPLFDTITNKAAVIVDFVDIAVMPESMAFEEVNPSTISQFTGMRDRCGKEIYEGDKDAFGNIVEWCDGGWCLNGDRPLFLFQSSFIVAGNIYENL